MKTAYLEIRSQGAKGTFPKSGPDTYVAVQVVPEGIEPLRYLNHRVAAKRGIEIIRIGEGYSSRQKTTRSALGSAIAEGRRLVTKINGNS